MSPAEACAGLTPAQVDALPRLLAWLSRPRVPVSELGDWMHEYESLRAIFGEAVKDG